MTQTEFEALQERYNQAKHIHLKIGGARNRISHYSFMESRAIKEDVLAYAKEKINYWIEKKRKLMKEFAEL